MVLVRLIKENIYRKVVPEQRLENIIPENTVTQDKRKNIILHCS